MKFICLSRALWLEHGAMLIKLHIFHRWLTPVQLRAWAGQILPVPAKSYAVLKLVYFNVSFPLLHLGTKRECVLFPSTVWISWVGALTCMLQWMKIIEFKVCKSVAVDLQESWALRILELAPFAKDKRHLDTFIGGNCHDPAHSLGLLEANHVPVNCGKIYS